MPLKLRSYGFLEPSLAARIKGRRSLAVGAFAVLLLAGVSAGALVGFSVGRGGNLFAEWVIPLGTETLVANVQPVNVPVVGSAIPSQDSQSARAEITALSAENSKLTEELRAYEALQDKALGVGREVSIAPVTVRSAAGGWRFFALVSGGVTANTPFHGNAVIELAGGEPGADERVLSDVPAKAVALDYRTGQILNGEIPASNSPASAIRLLVVDDAGRTRATQRVPLP